MSELGVDFDLKLSLQFNLVFIEGSIYFVFFLNSTLPQPQPRHECMVGIVTIDIFLPCKNRWYSLPERPYVMKLRASKIITRYADDSWNPSEVNDRRSRFPRAVRNSFISSLISYTWAHNPLITTERMYETAVSWLESTVCPCTAKQTISYWQHLFWRSWWPLWLLQACLSLQKTEYWKPVFQWITQWVPTAGCALASPAAHLQCSTARIWRDLSAAWLCSCQLLWRSDECVSFPCFNAQPVIFAVMNCCVVALTLIFPDSLTRSDDSSYSVQRHI